MSRKKDPSDQTFRDSSAKLNNTASNNDEDQELLALKRLIYRMPDREAPAGLTESILSSLKPKTVPGWLRIYRWALRPLTVTFQPLKMVPAAMVLVLGLVIAFQLGPWQKNQDSMDPRRASLIPVTFTLSYPAAKSVSLIGSFNQWNPTGHKMQQLSDLNTWTLELRLPEGRHEYAFLVDG
ncbi:MAG: glycogen-binding domain-containing protein, partial [Deltaproteobacteria bacterium]